MVALTLGPLMLPALVTGVGLLQLFQYVGLREYIGFTALLVGHVVICLPFAVRTVAISLQTLPPNVELAAASLGASRWRTLWHVVFPLIKSGIIAGAVFAFVHSFTDVNLSIFLARPGRAADHGQDPRLPRVRLRADARGGLGDHAAAAARPGRGRASGVTGLGDFIYGRARACLSRRCASPASRSATAPTVAVAGIDLEVREGEFLTLLGPSGCGKTTTLGLIAGFFPPTRGRDLPQGPAGRRPAAVQARHRRRVPGLRAVPAHDGGGERRVRPAHAQASPKAEIAAARRRGARPGAAARPGERRPLRALRRPAPARRARPRAGDPARRCCCSTSRCPTSTSSCARRCASRSPACSAASASPRCSSPTTRARRW